MNDNAATIIATQRAKVESDDALVATANAIISTPKTYFASYRTFEAMLGSAKVNAIQAAVKQLNPRWDAFLSVPGDEKGSGGGIDVALPEVQAALQQLVTAQVLAQADADQIKALGQTSVPQWQLWKLPAALTLADVAQAVAQESVRVWMTQNLSRIQAKAGVLKAAVIAGNNAPTLPDLTAALA